ncbi:hypothetical protein DPMN_040147 [Dreissena polymorpha]|uniref:Uncharacterized protein n=1 Tax=Dreissena polymorpha TaxID=45954 RepID=A0A9D4CUE4_DREPO|nr:hypothetical protein DPMN_040095 [Dreissena polymorpha]KAH3733714.1 hypothetical protein DPMN_040147 [Dreissena polymorpha]
MAEGGVGCTESESGYSSQYSRYARVSLRLEAFVGSTLCSRHSRVSLRLKAL